MRDEGAKVEVHVKRHVDRALIVVLDRIRNHAHA